MEQKQEEILRILMQQEETLIFDAFGAEDAWAIGTAIRGKIAGINAGAVIDITCHGIALFTACTTGAVPHNFTWVTRKRNTVLEYWKSSYRVSLELEQSHKTFEQRGLESIRYAASGGGFPICLKKSGVIGAVVVSGMTQEQDHQFTVDAISAHLSRPISSVCLY